MEMKEGLGFEITELRLGLPGGDDTKIGKPQCDKKRLYRDISNVEDDESPRKVHCNREEFIANKSQVAVVGWPPVCSYRKRKVEAAAAAAAAAASKVKMYNNVKVSMDGAPFLRKIDLSTLHDYEDLKASFQKLFFHQLHHSGGTGTAAGEVVKLKNGESSASEYIIIYEDKEDGDWMLLGDVPWKMFVESCKRLRIMKKSDAERFKLKSENLNH